MTHKLILWYSVRNGGDGSAYPTFMESEKLAEWDQENMVDGDGWGESCTGYIELESDSPIKVNTRVLTKEQWLFGRFLSWRPKMSNELINSVEHLFDGPIDIEKFREKLNEYHKKRFIKDVIKILEQVNKKLYE